MRRSQRNPCYSWKYAENDNQIRVIAITLLITKYENRDNVSQEVCDLISQLFGPLKETIGSVWDEFKEYVLFFVEARKTE